MKKYYINAFTSSKEGGNPAGVVLDSDNLSDKEMLAIAAEIGFSETAFVSKSNVADFKVRFFTPVAEVDLCGHATIATFSLLKSLDVITDKVYTQETKAGILEIEATKNNDVFMEQLNPTQFETIEKKSIAKSLGITEDKIISPVQAYSTGLKDIIIHVESLEDLNNLKLDFKMITELSKKYDSVGYHVFTLETLNDNTAQCRNFAPLYDIDEEAATGTASGALSGYLIENNIVEVIDGINEFTFEQGYQMNRPSEIKGRIEVKNNKIEKVIIGGQSYIE